MRTSADNNGTRLLPPLLPGVAMNDGEAAHSAQNPPKGAHFSIHLAFTLEEGNKRPQPSLQGFFLMEFARGKKQFHDSL